MGLRLAFLYRAKELQYRFPNTVIQAPRELCPDSYRRSPQNLSAAEGTHSRGACTVILHIINYYAILLLRGTYSSLQDCARRGGGDVILI